MTKAPILAVISLALSYTGAAAVSGAVKEACRSDYYAFCPQHEVGSQPLRECMRSARKKLSKACVKALADSDEVTEEDVKRYKREMHGR